MLTSLQNPRIQFARKLSRRQVREKERAFVVEGAVAIGELLRSDLDVVDLFVDATGERRPDLEDAAAARGVEVTEVTPDLITAMSDTRTPQGIVAVARMPSDARLPAGASLVLVLAGVGDPGNAGTLIRSGVAAGVDAVIVCPGTVDPYSAKALRSAAGLTFGSTIVRGAPLEEEAAALRHAGIRTLGAAAASPTPMYEADLVAPVALVVGNEAAGLPEGSAELLDGTVAIPMPGPAESLNVGIAGAVLLFEAVRQRSGS